MRRIHARAIFRAGIRVVLAYALLGPASVMAVPVDVSGSVGYSYRSLTTEQSDATSNQLLGIVRASSYLWQPWIATVEGGATLAVDNSDMHEDTDGGRSASSSSKVVSGDVVLNVLSQSRTPFRLSYQMTDSRVDNTVIDNPLVRLYGEDFKTTTLDARQSYIWEEGHRAQLRYGSRTWESDRNGTYDDNVVGVELDYRPEGQRLLARANVETIDQSKTDRHQDNLLLDVNHYYYPTEALRFDSTASLYNLDTNFEGNAGLVDSTVTDITQLSSFGFWRPTDQRWTVSGGVRVMDMNGENSAQSSSQTSAGVTMGAFYQYTQRLRFDGNFNYSTTDVNGTNEYVSQQHLGTLYESDLVDIKGFSYRWYGNASAENQNTPSEEFQSLLAALGHDAQKLWWTSESATLRFSVSQSLNEIFANGDQESTQRLDHSATVAWNQSSVNGTTLVQMTLADSRNFGGVSDEQQLVNFQASRLQNLSMLSSLTGNLTLQTVHRDFAGQSNNDTVTSATGQVNYQHMRIFGVPQLRFNSDLRLSQASTDEGADRHEWENRLDYTIGLVDASVSYRIFEDGVNNSKLLYLRVMRRF